MSSETAATPDPRAVASPLRRAIFSGVLVVVFLALGAMGFKALADQAKDSRQSARPAPPALVRSAEAARTTYVEKIQAYGRARALRRTTVSAEVAGTVTQVIANLEAGRSFDYTPKPTHTNGSQGTPPRRDESGPVVLEIDTAELADMVTKAEGERAVTVADKARLDDALVTLDAQMQLAQAELAATERERDRVAKLVADGRKLPPSQLDIEELKVLGRKQLIEQLKQRRIDNTSQKQVLTQRLAVQQTAIDMAKRNLRRADVRLPFPGVIDERRVNVGDRVGPGQALFTILDLQTVEIPIPLPARTFHDVQVGAEVVLHRIDGAVLEDGGETLVAHRGTVARKAPRIDEGARVYLVYVEVSGTPTSNPVAPGAFFRATVTGRTHENVFAVSREAFSGRDLFLVDPPAEPDTDGGNIGDAPGRRGIARRVTPTVSHWLPDVALVTGGLDAGDEYVTTNLESVAAGGRLRLAADADDTR